MNRKRVVAAAVEVSRPELSLSPHNIQRDISLGRLFPFTTRRPVTFTSQEKHQPQPPTATLLHVNSVHFLSLAEQGKKVLYYAHNLYCPGILLPQNRKIQPLLLPSTSLSNTHIGFQAVQENNIHSSVAATNSISWPSLNSIIIYTVVLLPAIILHNHGRNNILHESLNQATLHIQLQLLLRITEMKKAINF